MRRTYWWILCAVLGLGGCGGGGGSQVVVSPPVCSPSVSALDFGSVTVGQTKDLTLTITNSGQGTLTGTATEACSDYSIQGAASYSLGPGVSAVLTIRFAPSAAGSRPCTLSPGTGCANVPCTGIGVATDCQLSSANLAFGTVLVGASVDRTFTITNAGTATLAGTVSSPCADFSIQGTATYSLGSGESATFTVRFTPTAGGLAGCEIDTGNALCAHVFCSGTAVELSSGLIAPAATYHHTFQVAGTYAYHCEIHTVMRGSVIVDPSSSVTSASVSIVAATSSGFSPSTVTVAPGATVTWTNNHSQNHTVTSD